MGVFARDEIFATDGLMWDWKCDIIVDDKDPTAVEEILDCVNMPLAISEGTNSKTDRSHPKSGCTMSFYRTNPASELLASIIQPRLKPVARGAHVGPWASTHEG